MLDKAISAIGGKTCAIDITPFALYVPNGTAPALQDTFGPMALGKDHSGMELLPRSKQFWSCVDVGKWEYLWVLSVIREIQTVLVVR